MKKYFLMAVFVMAVCVSLTACGGDDDTEVLTFEKMLTGRYYILDSNKKVTYSFYKNHLVICDGGVSVGSGMLAGGDSFFLGKWEIAGDKLMTTFTSGSYGGFDWNQILYGTLTLKDMTSYSLTFTDPYGTERELFNNQNKTFVDYTDATAHDGAVQGTWKMQAYSNNQPINCTMEVKKDGTARFVIPELEIDFTTTYTTKDGHIMFESYLLPNSKEKNSFIYIREANELQMITEDTAVRVWNWKK